MTLDAPQRTLKCRRARRRCCCVVGLTSGLSGSNIPLVSGRSTGRHGVSESKNQQGAADAPRSTPQRAAPRSRSAAGRAIWPPGRRFFASQPHMSQCSNWGPSVRAPSAPQARRMHPCTASTRSKAYACGCPGLTARRRSERLDVDDYLTRLADARAAAKLPIFQAIEPAAVELSPRG